MTPARTPEELDALVEELAQLIAPNAFKSWQAMVDWCTSNGNSPDDANMYATNIYGDQMIAARDKAAAVLPIIDRLTADLRTRIAELEAKAT